MQAGIIFGYLGQVDEVVIRMKKELGEKAKVVATGGLASLIGHESKTIEVINDILTLQGLMILDKMI